MKNIIVINPPNKPFTNKGILAEPIDALEIATIIKGKYEDVKFVDMDALRMSNNINSYLEDCLNILIFVYDYQIPLHTPQTLDNIFEIVKNIDREVKSIAIGKVPTFYHSLLIKNNIDVVISGIVETRINEVIDNIDKDNLFNIKGLYISKGSDEIYTGDFSEQYCYGMNPNPDRSLINPTYYMDTKTIISSRGCNGACKFCSTPSFFGKWTKKSTEKIIDEIKTLINLYNTKQILFLDDNFTVDKKRVIDICNQIINEKINIKLGCLSSIKNYDEEMFKLMYKAGFRWVHFGIESGSERILKEMNKPMNLINIRTIIKTLKSIGFRIRTSFILDYPNQNNKDLIDTLNLIEELDPDEIRLHFLSYRVGTPLFKESELKDQFIHQNKSDNLDKESLLIINNLLDSLKSKNYIILKEEIDWSNTKDLNKIVSFIPIKYGVGWND